MIQAMPLRGALLRRIGAAGFGLLALVAAAASTWAVSRSISDAGLDRQPGLRAEGEVRAALRRQPLDAEALRDLALSSGTGTGEGLALLHLADRVSRRDPATQLLLLEAGAQGGDIPATLHRYDVLFSTAPNFQEVLQGVLERAIADPVVRAGLRPYSERPWLASLVKSTARRPGQGMTALSLAREAGLLARQDSRDAVAPNLISRLVLDDRPGEALALADELGVQDWQGAGFTRATLDSRLGSLGWQLEQTASASAEWKRPDALFISVEPGRWSAVARRVTVLAAGQYRLSFSIEALAQPLASLEWRISCASGAGAVQRVTVRPGTMLQAYRENLAVPANCPVQEWGLWAEGADAQIASRAVLLGLRVDRE